MSCAVAQAPLVAVPQVGAIAFAIMRPFPVSWGYRRGGHRARTSRSPGGTRLHGAYRWLSVQARPVASFPSVSGRDSRSHDLEHGVPERNVLDQDLELTA